MGTYFDSKLFNPDAFAAYVDRIPNVVKTELVRSGAVGTNAAARTALSTQTGSLSAHIPYFGLISGSTSQNNNGATNITSTNTSTYEQGFITASRMDAWTERSFSTNITAGVNFMDNVAAQLSTYKNEVMQGMLLAMLKGVFGMTTTGSTPSAAATAAAKEFVEKHTYDITAEEGDAALVGPATLNSAIQQACGDNKNIFTLAIMHSVIATHLENQKLLEYMKYTDRDGIERQLPLAHWNGRLVLVDDSMPVEHVDAVDADPGPAADAYDKYTTYLLGNGAIILDNIGDSVPYEMHRDPKTNGGEDTLYVRDRYICGVNGLSFEKPSTLTASASNTDLSTGTNWVVINNGTDAISHKSIAIARIISKG